MGAIPYLPKFNRIEAIKVLKEFNNAQKINSLLDDVPLENLYLEKYDYLLPKSILRKSFINSIFNIEKFLKYINSKSDFYE